MEHVTSQRLANQTCLITGASSGFGRAIALACAAEGADIALVARSEDKLQDVATLIRKEGRQVVVCPADIGTETEVLAAIKKAKGALGKIDILVNNAGTNIAQRSIAETSSQQWRRLLDVNLSSAFLFTQALLPEMIAREHGTIINIASRAASQPSLLAGVAYSTSKRGMEALTKISNEEANPHNVRACVINPGEGNTPIMDLRPAPPSEERRQRMIQSEDIAQTVVLVASLPQRVNIELIEMKPTRK